MGRTKKHHVSESSINQRHTTINEGQHENLAELGIGLHHGHQVISIEFDDVAGLLHAHTKQSPPAGQHAHFTGELPRPKQGDQRFGIPRLNDFNLAGVDHENMNVTVSDLRKQFAALRATNAAVSSHSFDLPLLQRREKLFVPGIQAQASRRICIRHALKLLPLFLFNDELLIMPARSIALRDADAGIMMSMESAEDRARAIFGERSVFYSTSPTHTDPRVLQRVVSLAKPQPHWNALDIATGSGHTAFALSPHVNSVIGIDITGPMLAEAERLRREKTLDNVTFQIGDVHHLAFENESFDLVTCRRAAHHFSDIKLALAEMQRVLRRGGRLIVDDRSVPEDDFLDPCMNLLDTYHDESHIREYRPEEWRRMLEEIEFHGETIEPYQHRPLTSLTRDVSEKT